MRTTGTANPEIAASYLQSKAIARGHAAGALAHAEGSRQPREVVTAHKADVAAVGTNDYPADSLRPVNESFLGALYDGSVPEKLTGKIAVPMYTRLYANSTGIIGSRITEGTTIPVLRGDWTTVTLKPIPHAGIFVETEELARSRLPGAALSVLRALAQATAEAENRSFASPEVVGSVLYGAPSFSATGGTVADIDADLKRLLDLVPGASMPGAAFVMTKETATHLSLVRGTGGAAAYPDITPQGGRLLGLPVLITSACAVAGSPPTRVIGLINPSEIFWADEGKVTLSASADALLEMSDAPTGNSLTPTPTTLVSMFQAGAVALRAVRESAWYARAGSGAYFVTGY